jgi:hypothetical protein
VSFIVYPLDQEIIIKLFDFDFLVVLHENKGNESLDTVPAPVIFHGYNFMETYRVPAE